MIEYFDIARSIHHPAISINAARSWKKDYSVSRVKPKNFISRGVRERLLRNGQRGANPQSFSRFKRLAQTARRRLQILWRIQTKRDAQRICSAAFDKETRAVNEIYIVFRRARA